MYLTENTSLSASVEFVRDSGQIMRAADCKNLAEKPEGVFRQAKKDRSLTTAVFVQTGSFHDNTAIGTDGDHHAILDIFQEFIT